jgi:hypothetical protein
MMIVNTSALVGDGGAKLAVYNGQGDEAADTVQVVTAGTEVDVQVSEQFIEAVNGKPEFNEDKFWREVELIGELSRLRSERADIEASLAEVKQEHAAIKDSMSDVKERMSDLEADLKDKTDEFMQVADELCAVASGLVAQLPPKALAEQTEQAAQSDDGWRAYPTVELLKSMKGGKKKEAIIDLAPTAGDIQDLRVEASKKCIQFAQLLPDRCGEKIAQQVEDCLIEFIEKWDKDRHNPQVTIQADDLLAEIRAAAEQNGWTIEDCKPKETDSPSLRAGFLAFGEGRPHTDVVIDDLNAAKQWMIGWVGNEMLSKES